MNATRGNGYAPAWGSLVMMMMMISQLRGVTLSLAIWDHTVLLSTRHKLTHRALTPAS